MFGIGSLKNKKMSDTKYLKKYSEIAQQKNKRLVRESIQYIPSKEKIIVLNANLPGYNESIQNQANTLVKESINKNLRFSDNKKSERLNSDSGYVIENWYARGILRQVPIGRFGIINHNGRLYEEKIAHDTLKYNSFDRGLCLVDHCPDDVYGDPDRICGVWHNFTYDEVKKIAYADLYCVGDRGQHLLEVALAGGFIGFSTVAYCDTKSDGITMDSQGYEWAENRCDWVLMPSQEVWGDFRDIESFNLDGVKLVRGDSVRDSIISPMSFYLDLPYKESQNPGTRIKDNTNINKENREESKMAKVSEKVSKEEMIESFYVSNLERNTKENIRLAKEASNPVAGALKLESDLKKIPVSEETQHIITSVKEAIGFLKKKSEHVQANTIEQSKKIQVLEKSVHKLKDMQSKERLQNILYLENQKGMLTDLIASKKENVQVKKDKVAKLEKTIDTKVAMKERLYNLQNIQNQKEMIEDLIASKKEHVEVLHSVIASKENLIKLNTRNRNSQYRSAMAVNTQSQDLEVLDYSEPVNFVEDLPFMQEQDDEYQRDFEPKSIYESNNEDDMVTEYLNTEMDENPFLEEYIPEMERISTMGEAVQFVENKKYEHRNLNRQNNFSSKKESTKPDNFSGGRGLEAVDFYGKLW